jgi:sugar-specific transcriptional regulator TrmB
MQALQTSRIKQSKEPERLAVERDNFTDLDPDLLQFARTFASKEGGEHEGGLKALRSINNALKRFKLSKNEVKVYLYLAQVGAQKAQKIATSLGIHRTEAYKILRALESNGVVSRILERPMKFAAVAFEEVLNNEIEERRQIIHKLEKRKSELLRQWEVLPKIAESNAEKETLQVLEGKRQISIKINELTKQTTHKLQAVVSDKHLIWLYNSPFFDDLEMIMKKREMDVKVMTIYSPTSTYVIEQLNTCDCDFAFLQIHDQPSFLLSDNGSLILLIDSEDRFYAMETNYESMVKSYQNLFDLLWKNQPKKK